MAGVTDKVAGKAKQAAGKATDDERLEREGRVDEAAGKVKAGLSGAVDAVKDATRDRKH